MQLLCKQPLEDVIRRIELLGDQFAFALGATQASVHSRPVVVKRNRFTRLLNRFDLEACFGSFGNLHINDFLRGIGVWRTPYW